MALWLKGDVAWLASDGVEASDGSFWRGRTAIAMPQDATQTVTRECVILFGTFRKAMLEGEWY